MSFTEGPVHERTDAIVHEPAAVVDVPVNGTVVTPVVAAPTTAGSIRTAYNARFAPDSIIAGIAGLVILLVGLIAIVRAGFDGPMSDPVVQVLGFTHTATLGLIEVGIGLALLLSGATRSRSGEIFFGSLLGIGAFVGAVQSESFAHSLALESSMAWILVIIALAVVLSAMLMPRYVRQSTVIEHL
jgi:hypothetical protein